MRGTGYAVTEIILWMVAAGLVGLAIGWILRSFVGGGARLEESEAKLEKEKERYAQISSELGEWKRKIGKLNKKLESRDTELGTAKELNAQLEEDLTAVRADMAGMGSQVGELEETLAGTRADLDAAATRARDLEGKINTVATEKEAEIQRLSGAAAGSAELQAAIGQRDERLEELSAELSQLRADHAACGVSSEEQRGTIAGLESQVEGRDAEIRRLESELSAAQAGQVATSHESQTLFAADAIEPAGPSWQQGVTTLGTPGDAHQDDLRVINGVGKKLQEVLNGFGIQSWEQVAALTPDEVARVDDALNFPGRIERDQWVEQAGDLIARFPDRENRPTRETFLNEAPE